jgi:crotonobetainyl-CoA:carnitine CoA-transferase CaiB-like acyl-CoA transferase
MRSLQALSETDWSVYWGAVQEVSDRHGGTYRLPGRPWHFSADQLEPIGDPAFQGEHNRAVFCELGLSEDEIERFIATGALVSDVPASTAPIGEPAKA